MRVVFIHGMKNEKQDPEALKTRWHDAMREGWRRAGVSVTREYTVDLPYYGDTLHGLTDGAADAPGVERRGPEDVGPNVGDFEQEYYKLLKEKLGIPDEAVAEQLPPRVRERGPANWEWVQAIARAVQDRAPEISEFALKAVPQVDGYLNRPNVQRAVDAIVEPTLAQGKTIVIAHSLGTIVTYRLLKKLSGSLDVPVFFTIGSPLGIDLVVRRIRPIMTPQTVGTWINAVDQRDYVALVAKLEKPNYSIPITNITDLENEGKDAHSITEYLKQKPVAEAIARGMA
jgi:hypothetical protein